MPTRTSQSRGVPPSARAHFWFLVCGLCIVILLPLLGLGVAYRLWVRRRALVGIRSKLTGQGPAVPRGSILIHGVSLGEVAMMRSLIEQLPPTAPVLLTSTTETGQSALERQFPTRARATWPLDLPWAITTFLRRTRPRIIILLEAELWPLALLAARARGIPVVVLNARSSPRSHRRWSQIRPIAKRLIGSLAFVVAQDATYAARFRDLGVPAHALAISGSLKADMVRPASPSAIAAERLALGDGQLLLLASTSSPEETILIRSWLSWGKPNGWRCVLVPRHPERGRELVELCNSYQLSAKRTSEPGHQSQTDVLIIDEIGRLAALYALCAAGNGIAVVGGSLGSGRGGQNMLEAAAAGCCTVVGWDTSAQPDPMRILRQAHGVVELEKTRLDLQLSELATDPARRQALAAAGQQSWSNGRGALARTMRALAQSGHPLNSAQSAQDDHS